MGYQGGEWGEGTPGDLVADAHALGVVKAGTRMLDDWVEQGLLDRPRPCRISGHGCDSWLFPVRQRELFTRLLTAREGSVAGRRLPQRSLVPVVLHVWLIDDDVVPFSQARRAWRTHARAVGRPTAAKRRETARAVVEQLAHPSAGSRQRRAAQLAIEEGERTGRVDREHRERLTAVLSEVCSPWPTRAGAPKIERALSGPFGPASVQSYLTKRQAARRTIGRLGREEIGETVLDRVRVAYRRRWPEYRASRAAWAAGAGVLADCFAEPATVERRAHAAVDVFLEMLADEMLAEEKLGDEMLGDEIGLIGAATDVSESARVRPAYRQVS